MEWFLEVVGRWKRLRPFLTSSRRGVQKIYEEGEENSHLLERCKRGYVNLQRTKLGPTNVYPSRAFRWLVLARVHAIPEASANCLGIVFLPAGILISFPFVVLLGINY